MNTKWIMQIAEDEKGRASAGRIGFLSCLLFSSIIMLWLTSMDRMTEGYFFTYTGVFGATFVGGKWVDKGAKNDSRNSKRV